MFIDDIFSWRPIEDQWWITGFNPKYKDEKADAKNQVMIGSVQFPNDKMYEAIKMNVRVYQKQYAIFDDAHYTIWLCWYDGGMKE